MDDNKPQQPMSIEQAGNYIAEKKKTMAADLKQEAAGAIISQALDPDRRAYLLNAMMYFDRVSPEVERAFLIISGTISSSLTNRQIAELLKKIMVCRIYGYGINAIAQQLKEPIEKVAQLEELGKIAVGEQLKRYEGMPMIGKN